MRFLLGILLLGLLSLHATAQEPDFAKLHKDAVRGVKSLNATGMALAIVKDGDVVFQSGYGVADAVSGENITTSSMFGIASLSKAFTVTIIAQLVEEGKLNWTDRVTWHLPDWKLNNDTITALMTVEDLLCHRSGLITFDGDLLWYGTNYTREEIVERIRYRPLSQDYRTKFGYQNIMYITAGELIEAVTGKSWDENVKERIFKPLGMVQSNTSISQYKSTQQIAYPHIKGEKQNLLNYDNSGATAAINSNLTDLSKWITMWANEGVYDGDTIISKASFDRITRLHTVLPTGGLDKMVGTNFKGYGLGWFVFDYKGNKVVHHGGGLPGYITKLAFVPEKDLGIVVLTNDMSSLTTAMMYEILEAYSEEDTTDFISLFADFSKRRDASIKNSQEKKEAKRNLDNKPGFENEKYVGVYTDKMYGDARVSIRGKRRKAHLYLELLPSKELFQAKLEPFNGDTFKVVFNDPFLPPGYVTFDIEGDKVLGFTIDLENPDFHFYKLDFKKK